MNEKAKAPSGGSRLFLHIWIFHAIPRTKIGTWLPTSTKPMDGGFVKLHLCWSGHFIQFLGKLFFGNWFCMPPYGGKGLENNICVQIWTFHSIPMKEIGTWTPFMHPIPMGWRLANMIYLSGFGHFIQFLANIFGNFIPIPPHWVGVENMIFLCRFEHFI